MRHTDVWCPSVRSTTSEMNYAFRNKRSGLLKAVRTQCFTFENSRSAEKRSRPVMLNYAGEYGKYCDACQAAVTVIRSRDAALKSCLEWLTMSYIIGDSAYWFSVQFCRQTDMDKPGNVWTQTNASSWNGHLNDSTHSRTPAHIKGSVASLYTRVGTAPSSCIPASQYSLYSQYSPA